MAASLDGACHKEVTVFSGSVHRDNLAAYIPLATEMITQPRFAPEDFERLRNEALDYVTKYLRGNNDEELGKWTLQVELYKDHPYGHPDRGTAQGLKAITLDDVKAFHRRHYTREALDAGHRRRFRSADASACCEQGFGELPLRRPRYSPSSPLRACPRGWRSRSSRSRPTRRPSRSAFRST